MTAAAFIAVNLMTPRYKSEARVLVEGRENIFLRPEADKAMIDRGTIDAETVTSQVQLILSRDLAREVIKDLNLTELPEFNAALKRILAAVGACAPSASSRTRCRWRSRSGCSPPITTG